MYREQLRFNLNCPTEKDNLQRTFQKPRPIVIEKLLPSKAPVEPANQFQVAVNSNVSRPSSSLSSERLEFAMQLAKRDVKKLKSMLSDPGIQIPDVLQNRACNQAVVSKQQNVKRQVKREPLRSEAIGRSKREKKQIVGKVLSAEKSPPKDVNYKNGQLKFVQYDGEHRLEEDEDEKPQTKEVTEIKRLRRELQKYMKRLDSVLDEKSNKFQNQAAGVKSLVDDATEKERKMVRVEEQASRSARVLYMLQRKVQEIQDELEKPDGRTKHTQKSQHLTRLAAAHRSAVRALQMFVNQAPLYFDVKHGLPPMYQELGLLIQQLSLLSSQLHVSKDAPDFSMDLLPKTKKLISNWNVDKTPVKRAAFAKTNKPQEQRKIRKPDFGSRQKVIQEKKRAFLDRHSDWFRDKARDIGIVDDEEYADSTTSNEPTPEREAVLKAGLDALRRARETSSFVATDVKQKPSGVSFQIPKPSNVIKRRPKSVLFPHQIKKQRHQSATLRPKAKPTTTTTTNASQRHAQPSMHFAKQTVASILKKQDEIKFEPKKRLVPTSPKQVQIHNDSFTGHDTPRQRDKQILESCSPSTKRRNIPRSDVSPRAIRSLAYVDQNDSYYERNSPQYDRNMMEKEVVRQAWLDRERDRELRRLESLRNKEADNLRGIRQEYINSQKMVEDAEKKIKSTLQPLLEKAEFISHQEKLRNDQDKKSVKGRLGEIVTETAMSKGELLAELILDDVLMETVEELQRIELEENAEVHARFESDRPNIEAVRQRLEEFEREEEEIRRRWKAFHYSELDPAYQSEYVAKGVTRDAIGARPIVFTAVSGEVPKQKSQNKMPTSTHDNETNAKPRLPVNCDDVIQEFVPKEMRQSILAYKGRYDKYLGRTLTEKHGRFDPYKLIERISDEILEEIVADVGRELDDICDDYVENIYGDEFVRNDSLISQTSNDTVTSKRGSSISTSISP
eukprot:gene13777-15219_t